jgi:uncharacterized membrane protein
VSRKEKIGVFASVFLLLFWTLLMLDWNEPVPVVLVIVTPLVIPWGIWWTRKGK